MGIIKESFKKFILEIESLKNQGVSFDWKGIDLSDLLISELINNKSSDYYSLNKKKWIKHFKNYIYFKSKQLKYLKNNLNRSYDLLVFINTYHQWEVLETICEILEAKGFKILYLTTKESLFKEVFLNKVSKKLICGYSLINYKICSEGEGKIGQVVNWYFSKIAFLHRFFCKTFKSSQIKFVLIGNDATFEGKLLSEVANFFQIKTGTVQHGSINRLNPVRGLSVVDFYFVFGEAPASELILLGKNKGEIVLSGWPLQCKFKEKAKISKLKNLSSFNSDILICLSGLGHSIEKSTHLKVIDMVKQLQKKFKLTTLVKLHPKDNKENYLELNDDLTIILDNSDLIRLNVNLIDLITVAKCTLTIASTAALESLLLETPVITVDINKEFSDVDFISDGLTYNVCNYFELETTYQNILNETFNSLHNNKMKSSIENYFYNYFTDDFNPNRIISEKIMEVLTK